MKEQTRLNKFISHNSKYSRREADALIADGVVKINKQLVTNLATFVKEDDIVYIKDKRVYTLDKFSVIVYNKVKGELVTKIDDRGRTTIYHSLPSRFSHFRYAGRLDFASEGLLLLSDSVKVVSAIANSSIQRVYLVKVNGAISNNVITAMQNGISIENSRDGAHEHSDILDMDIAPFSDFKIIKNTRNYSKLKLLMTEGKNREIRRFFAHFTLDVLDLKRVSFGWISLNNLPSKKYRYLTSKEYQELRAYMKKSNSKETKVLAIDDNNEEDDEDDAFNTLDNN